MTNDQGELHVCFMIAKARVAPLKQMTIPRMKLATAVLSVGLDKLLNAELHLPIQSSTFWVDSQAALKYIANDSARLKLLSHSAESPSLKKTAASNNGSSLKAGTTRRMKPLGG